MENVILVCALTAGAFGLCFGMIRKLVRRTHALERELQHMSQAISEMADIQLKTHRKCSVHFEEMEERIMELSVPSQDSGLPLERRHQVLALARQGVGLEEIVKRLKAPAGEAELILNLRKYMGGENSPTRKINGQVRHYA